MNKQQQNTNMSQPILIYVRLLMYIYLKALLCGTGQVTGQCISIHITTGLTLEIILYNSMLGKSAKKCCKRSFAKPYFWHPPLTTKGLYDLTVFNVHTSTLEHCFLFLNFGLTLRNPW